MKNDGLWFARAVATLAVLLILAGIIAVLISQPR